MSEIDSAIEYRRSIRRLLSQALQSMHHRGSISATRKWIKRMDREIEDLQKSPAKT